MSYVYVSILHAVVEMTLESRWLQSGSWSLMSLRWPSDQSHIPVLSPHLLFTAHPWQMQIYTVAPQKAFFKLAQCHPEFNICLWQIFTTFSELCNWFVIHALLKVWWAKEKSWLMETGAYGYRSFEIWSFPDSLGPQLAWTKFMCLCGLRAPLWHQGTPQQKYELHWPFEERHYWSKQKLGVLGLTLEAPLLKARGKFRPFFDALKSSFNHSQH